MISMWVVLETIGSLFGYLKRVVGAACFREVTMSWFYKESSLGLSFGGSL